MRTSVFIVLLVSALGMPTEAQTLTEQLQKGIYTEEILRNGPEAERICREMLAAPTLPQPISREVQRRLARLLRARQPTRVGDATMALPDGRLLGAVEQGRYRHLASGITFDVPAGWTVRKTVPSSDHGDQVILIDETTGQSINVWMLKEDVPADLLAEQVAGAPAEKVRQRHSGYGIPGMVASSTYTIPLDTIRLTSINVRQAIVAVGDYWGMPLERLIVRDGARPVVQPMKEYMTWINTEHARAFFFARVPVDDLPQLGPVFEQVVSSAAFQ